MRKSEILNTFVTILNEAIKADGAAVRELMECRVKCNDTLANHPTIAVLGDSNGVCTIGALGLINGVCIKLTGETICAELDDDGNWVKFRVL